MPKINPDVETFARIKVIGVGGSGKNALNHMINSKVKGIEFICMNTDTQDLHNSLASKKIHLGKNLTKGLGSGMNPETGRKSAEETKAEIQEVLKGSEMVFIAGGMGGGTGTGAAPVVARAAKEQGILTVAVVTRPFLFEGQQRSRIADQGLAELEKEVDALIVIPNDRLLSITEKDTTFKDAFGMCDEILRQAVEGISDLITTPGIINIDFADIKAVMSNAGSAFMGIGIAGGENRAKEATLKAINSPLLDISIEGARGVLFSIAGSDDLKMHEVQEAAKLITDSIDPEAKVIMGTINDNRLKKGEMKVTVIATGFNGSQQKKGTTFTQQRIERDLNPEKTDTGSNSVVQNRIDIQSNGSPKTSPIVSQPQNQASSSTSQKDSITIEAQAKHVTEDDDEKWGALPAFIRRAKK
ncbi:MAG: cell division protein FtsZ [Candidatus Pacebacteria bacterium]|nr:cell division protein FtsZ [Candidatus Paceibacterota bacterium]